LEETMRSRTVPALFLLGLLPSLLILAQDWRGKGRLDGWVRDTNGQPIANAKVELTREKGGGTSTKTNAKGYWAILGLIGGIWNVDVTVAGYEPRKLSVNVTEAGRVPSMEILLEKAAAPVAGAQPGRDVGAEITAAVAQGNKLLGEKKYAEARAEYEKALAVLPENPELWKGISQTYHGEGNKAKTEESLRKVIQLDPADTDTKILLGSLLIEEGKVDEGKAMIDALPPGAVKDPAVYTNLGIIFMNKKRPEEARAYMTRAIEIDRAIAESYYYRGLANIQAKKNAEAKVDFQKYLELAPNGPEAKEVKEMLQALR